MGLEPTRVYAHKILSLACLPIPALPHLYSFRRRSRIDSYIIPPGIEYCKHFFKKIYQENLFIILFPQCGMHIPECFCRNAGNILRPSIKADSHSASRFFPGIQNTNVSIYFLRS